MHDIRALLRDALERATDAVELPVRCFARDVGALATLADEEPIGV